MFTNIRNQVPIHRYIFLLVEKYDHIRPWLYFPSDGRHMRFLSHLKETSNLGQVQTGDYWYNGQACLPLWHSTMLIIAGTMPLRVARWLVAATVQTMG